MGPDPLTSRTAPLTLTLGQFTWALGLLTMVVGPLAAAPGLMTRFLDRCAWTLKPLHWTAGPNE